MATWTGKLEHKTSSDRELTSCCNRTTSFTHTFVQLLLIFIL
ncbi:hypothetical protein CsSME_00030440 [Camellia sinensis var. sinensis]